MDEKQVKRTQILSKYTEQLTYIITMKGTNRLSSSSYEDSKGGKGNITQIICLLHNLS